MITLDTSGLVALISPSDQHHSDAAATITENAGPYFVPTPALAEITYVLRDRAGPRLVQRLLGEFESGALTLDCGDQDIGRIRQLLKRYDDIGLDFPDAAVIACAERHAGRVLTLDRRHFDIVARGERTLEVLPSP